MFSARIKKIKLKENNKHSGAAASKKSVADFFGRI